MCFRNKYERCSQIKEFIKSQDFSVKNCNRKNQQKENNFRRYCHKRIQTRMVSFYIGSKL